jgi:hypothetical protein
MLFGVKHSPNVGYLLWLKPKDLFLTPSSRQAITPTKPSLLSHPPSIELIMVAKNTKRLGVGATAGTNTSKNALAEADWTRSGKKKILSVGKRHEEDDDDVIGHDSSSDDEGRTSAVKERKRKIVSVVNDNSDGAAADADAPKHKKKKKGKKERNASRADDQDKSNDSSEAKNLIETAVETSEDVERKKPKRKKTRSKQKNIRKDNRCESERPSYLNVGSSGYAGRPLTAATKEKLGLGTQEKDGLAASSTKKLDEQLGDGTAESENKKSEPVLKEESTKQLEDIGELSKIGDCAVGEIVASPRGVNEKSKKKQPKRKFKNC